jgi:hypothetical protein
MHLDPAGKKILENLMIDRFVSPEEGWYEAIRRMKSALKHSGDPEHATQKF